jgi:hypothetical protein
VSHGGVSFLALVGLLRKLSHSRIRRLFPFFNWTRLSTIPRNSPLFSAVFDARGDYRFVRALIAAGADPNHKNKSNKSPIDIAVTIGDETLRTLLEKGRQSVERGAAGRAGSKINVGWLPPG